MLTVQQEKQNHLPLGQEKQTQFKPAVQTLSFIILNHFLAK